MREPTTTTTKFIIILPYVQGIWSFSFISFSFRSIFRCHSLPHHYYYLSFEFEQLSFSFLTKHSNSRRERRFLFFSFFVLLIFVNIAVKIVCKKKRKLVLLGRYSMYCTFLLFACKQSKRFRFLFFSFQ